MHIIIQKIENLLMKYPGILSTPLNKHSPAYMRYAINRKFSDILPILLKRDERRYKICKHRMIYSNMFALCCIFTVIIESQQKKTLCLLDYCVLHNTECIVFQYRGWVSFFGKSVLVPCYIFGWVFCFYHKCILVPCVLKYILAGCIVFFHHALMYQRY